MKKILTVILTTAIALCVNAKTIEELVVELDNAKASNPNKFIAAIHDDVYQANKADVAVLYESWKKTNVARFQMDETDALLKEARARSKEQLKIDSCKNALCSRHIVNENLYEDAGRASINMASYRTAMYYKDVRPSWYDELKSNNFVVEGYKLDNLKILLIASVFKDAKVVMDTPIPAGIKDVVILNFIADALLRYDDVSVAYNKCEEVLGVLCKQGKTKTDLYIKLEGISKRLANRVIVKSVRK